MIYLTYYILQETAVVAVEFASERVQPADRPISRLPIISEVEYVAYDE